MADITAIKALIAASARGLGPPHYSSEQIESALRSAFGVDTQLIADQTYYLALVENTLAACGGWSYRETMFGSDQARVRSAERIEPLTGAARIRAFFVHPQFARLGIGAALLDTCESTARAAGYQRFELMATLSGLQFYRRHGYLSRAAIQHPLGDGLSIEFVPMYKG